MFTTDTTNFTVVLPGPCNAKCDFCLSKNDPKIITGYINKLSKAIKLVPKEINQVSISGGEPTISPVLTQVLPLLYKRFEKIVLTTNGYKVMDHISTLGKYITHLNISRHSADYARNQSIFGNNNVISDHGIEAVVDELSTYGVDVSLNCVYDEEQYYMSHSEAKELIRSARKMGAASVNFRFNQNAPNSLSKSLLEMSFSDHKPIGKGGCPVCFTRTYRILGMVTSFKYTVAEPSNMASSVYELIAQPNGDLTIDWEGEKSFESILKTEALLDSKPEPVQISAPPVSSCGGGSCGINIPRSC